MAEAALTDRDLASVQEARRLAQRARHAAPHLADLSQDLIDRIVDAMAAAIRPHAESLARLAVEETTFGVVEDKIQKNLFAAERVYGFIRPMRTVGVVGRDDARKIVEIAEPFGVVAAIVPSTNPTSTAIYKILISIKARCPIVMSPHPSATRCITRVAEIMAEAAASAGAPAGSINWMSAVSLEGTQELMKHRDVAVILATGGMGLVRAAYSAGKPAYGVGPGNAPCYVEESADLAKAADDIIIGKSFDNGVLCSSPNSVVVDRAVADEVKRQFVGHGGYFLKPDEAARLAAVLVTPQRLPNPKFVGKSAIHIAGELGIAVPTGTRALIAELEGVGRDYPLSIEKLCPVLSYYVVADWRQGCERCIQILRYGGMGHTMSIHSRNEDVILQFGLKKPAFRIVVNTPTTHGSIGLTTGLDPSMTLGCGGWGGNITSDNISPRHLLNIKRLAYETRPALRRGQKSDTVTARTASAPVEPRVFRPAVAPASAAVSSTPAPALPRAAAAPPAAGVDAAAMARQLESIVRPNAAAPVTAQTGDATTDHQVVDFVCEEDVRQAIRLARKIVIGERTIVTPAARDLAEAHRIFVTAAWPRS
jgi:acetaldehyde dehydrogenase (acetylating)